MKIGIHLSKGSFSDRWVDYCNEHHIPWKAVNCYSNDIIQQLYDCQALMWHFHQNDIKAALFAKSLILSIEAAGKKVFPDSNTAWHFDDKLAQKYLLEAIGAPLVPTWVFYNKVEALNWAGSIEYPIVYKLRCGASSQNVKLIRTYKQARKIISVAFGRGHLVYDAKESLRERFRKYRMGKTNAKNVLKGLVRIVYPPEYARVHSREKGYVYFQKFVPYNDYDIRVIVIGNKAFAIKRMVREGDFRASGSGNILYDKSLFNEETIELSFRLAEKLKTQCVAFDYIFENGKPMVTEISYGFSPEGYDPCPGYWDKGLNWYEGKFNPYGWMVEDLVASSRIGEKT